MIAVVVVFVVHRVLVALSAGDFLFPIEPSEAKNTQIAWDLVSGRFGTDGFSLGNYVANTGSIHHASYSTAAAVYVAVARIAGFGVLPVRMVPLLFKAAAMLVWLTLLRRTLGVAAALLAGIALVLVPTIFVAYDLTFYGCHFEAPLPLSLAIGAWLLWCRDGDERPWTWALAAALAGYAACFSYLLWPLLALMALLSLLPPRPRLGPAAAGWAGMGFVVGLWPLWLILVLEGPRQLVGTPITEDESTTMLQLAAGHGLDWSLYVRTVRDNLPSGFQDYWMGQATAGAAWGGVRFEKIAYPIMVLGPLLLLPWAVSEAHPVRRRLLLLVAVGPALAYLWLCFASPWKPSMPSRYLAPLAFLGFSAPAMMAGVGLLRLRQAAGWRRAAGGVLALAGVGVIAWEAPLRWIEAVSAIRLERAPQVSRHRYVTYYNLGIGTVWAEMVDDVNDLVDVRSDTSDPRAFDGVQAGLWGSGRSDALGEGDWDPPELDWGSMRSGLNEWAERQSFVPAPDKDDPRTVALNMGWGAGIRARWNAERVARILQDAAAEGSWPEMLDVADFWEGFGFGWGRALDDVPAHADSLPLSIPEQYREDVIRGMAAGRELGEVPEAPRKPVFASVRGPAT